MGEFINPMFEIVQPRFDAHEPFVFPTSAFDQFTEQAKDRGVACLEVANIAAHVGRAGKQRPLRALWNVHNRAFSTSSVFAVIAP